MAQLIRQLWSVRFLVLQLFFAIPCFASRFQSNLQTSLALQPKSRPKHISFPASDTQEMISTLAILNSHDSCIASRTWEASVYERLDDQEGALLCDDENVYWVLELYRVYRAYQNPELLDLIKQAYDTTHESFISLADAEDGKSLFSSFSSSHDSYCTTGSQSGDRGTQAGMKSSDTAVNSGRIGAFMTLSAYLSELEPSNSAFKEAAQLSLDFMTSRLWNGTAMIDPATCSASATGRINSSVLYIEGLSVWANITRNEALLSLLNDFVPSAVDLFRSAPSVDFSADGGLNSLVHALAVARERHPRAKLATYVDIFFTELLNISPVHSDSEIKRGVQRAKLLPYPNNLDTTSDARTLAVTSIEHRTGLSARAIIPKPVEVPTEPDTPAIGEEPQDDDTNDGGQGGGGGGGGGSSLSGLDIFLIVAGVIVGIFFIWLIIQYFLSKSRARAGQGSIPLPAYERV